MLLSLSPTVICSPRRSSLAWLPRKTSVLPAKRRYIQSQIITRSYSSQDEPSQLVSEPAPPPHHTNELPDAPGSPARFLCDGIIAANIIIFILQMANPNVTLIGIKSNELINQGEIWRFLTPAFLHGSFSHLFLNMLSLHSLGPVVEWTCGRERFTAIYFTAAITGNVLSYLGDDQPSLGASGAIFGLAGAAVVYFWRNRTLFGSRFDSLQWRLWITIGLNFGVGLFLPQIDEWGHLGGLLGGAASAFLLGPAYELCRVKGRDGVWLIDEPPLEALATPPRQVLK